MLCFTGEVFEQIDKYIGCKYTVTEIGHHKLGRHLVFLIEDEKNRSFILKIYGKAFRFCNELIGLKLLSDKIKCPKIIESGEAFTELEWMLMSKIDGVILENVWNEISSENKIRIMQEMGRILGKIHSLYEYDYYGIWEKCGTSILNHHIYLEYRKDSDRAIMRNIRKQDIPFKELLNSSYEKLTQYYENLKSICSPRLCHHDYSARNVLVKKVNNIWRVSGIIDFEHCYPDDSDIDFTDLYHTVFLDEPWLKKSFFEGYSEYMNIQEKSIEQKMNYYLLNKGLFICSWAYYAAPEYYLQGIELLKKLDKKL
ncbi:aminoglycoside phosphotransferase family protein [Proteiniborus sp.]|uniref:aminoglycoside phosphotransferase family protein n=1 Tax=Proteiniborus sp. TaxID=2079015 RepID=UPI0033173B42